MRGLLVIGHGSRRDEANATVHEVVRLLARPDQATTSGRARLRWDAVEPAFLELVQPDIVAGYGNLAATGCTEIVAHPFFLFDGSHTSRDIPAALRQARRCFPDTRWRLTAPLGPHPGVVTAVTARINEALDDSRMDDYAMDDPAVTANGWR